MQKSSTWWRGWRRGWHGGSLPRALLLRLAVGPGLLQKPGHAPVRQAGGALAVLGGSLPRQETELARAVLRPWSLLTVYDDAALLAMPGHHDAVGGAP